MSTMEIVVPTHLRQRMANHRLQSRLQNVDAQVFRRESDPNTAQGQLAALAALPLQAAH